MVSVIIPTKDRFDKLERLLHQLGQDGYPNKEVIVVDDKSAGQDRYQSEIYKSVKLVKNDQGPSLARCRNLGINQSKGEYLFLVDDDNVIDNNTISELVASYEKNDEIGVAGPMMYHFNSNIIWCAGISRNYHTSKTTYRGSGQEDNGQFTATTSEEFPNAFMVSRKVIERIGLFREDLFPFHYGEADYCKRASLAGYKIILVPAAKVWHDFKAKDMIAHNTRVTPNRAYYYGRNRVLFHRMYSKGLQTLSFFIFEYALIIPAYLLIMLRSGKGIREKSNLVSMYLKGVYDGIAFDKRKMEKVDWRA
jgi:GT2 family glycosyltransferase